MVMVVAEKKMLSIHLAWLTCQRKSLAEHFAPKRYLSIKIKLF